MNYNFDQICQRRNTGSLKWDIAENELPLWVADMDFQTAPEITEALAKRVSSGIFGYQIVPEEWYLAYQDWWKRRHHLTIEKESLIFCTGVVPAISCAVKRMTNTGDNIVVQTPVYDIFFHSIENHGRHVLENERVYNGTSYEIDFADLEKKLADPLTTMMILCNPHNPVGKIWSREELEKIGELCKKPHVLVLSDEIHCDLTEPGMEYLPFAAVSEVCANNSISCIAASKDFNLAGLQSAAVMIPDEAIRQKMERGLNSDEIAEPGTLSVDGTVAAFTKGEDWLKQLCAYIEENKKCVKAFLQEQLPEVKLTESHATYLLWLDCSHITDDTDKLCSFIRKETGLYLSTGSQYRGNGRYFLRMNLACPKAVVLEALDRLKRGINLYSKN